MNADESDRTDHADKSVDWRVAQSLTGGDEALLDELIAMFPAESAKHLNEIRAGIAADDAPRLTRGAHSLKSAAGMFGAARLAALALAMEQLGRASNMVEAATRRQALDDETARVAATLQQGRA